MYLAQGKSVLQYLGKLQFYVDYCNLNGKFLWKNVKRKVK